MKHLSTLLLAIVSLIMAHHPSVAQTGTPSAAPSSATALSPPNKNLLPHKAGGFVAGNRQIKSIQRSSFVNVSSANVIDFENVPTTYYFRDGNQNLGHYYPGVSFGPDVTVLDKVIYGYNSADYPPHSGNCVIRSSSHDTFYMTFDSPTNHVSFWYTAAPYGGTATAYLSGGGTEVLPLSKNIGSNTQLVFSSSNIASIAISAEANYFSLDDLSFDGSGSDQLAVTDTNNKPVVGIVCDNLRGMRSDLLDDLTITLPPTYANATVTGTVDGNVGRIVSGTGRVTYYPPDEYNEVQEPRDPVAHPEDFTKAAIRPVTLHLTANNQHFTQTIYIARPPVVLVHGINSLVSRWNPFTSAISDPNNESGLKIRTPFVAVDHYSYGNFKGNEPVEVGAARLTNLIDTVLTEIQDGLEVADYTIVHNFDDYQNHPLAVKRVDVVAWSYGGVITRWYIASDGTNPSASNDPQKRWYQRNYQTPLPNVRAFRNDIRKVITLGSMWRGAPLVNYLNETFFGSKDGVPFGMAPIPYNGTLGQAVFAVPEDSFMTQVPSMEVLAVDSKWMRQLIYRTSTPNPQQQAKPFDDDVAYGSVAGDDNRYPISLSDQGLLGSLGGAFNLCFDLDFLQQPSWFPYLPLEQRTNSTRNYSDGLVPLWSSAIPGSYKIVSTTHDAYNVDQETRNYAVQWLNHAALPHGGGVNGNRGLNDIWNDPTSWKDDRYAVRSADQSKTWQFLLGKMAPYPESDFYQLQSDGVGRINQNAIGHPSQISLKPFVSLSRQGNDIVATIVMDNSYSNVLVPDVQIISASLKAGSVITYNPNSTQLGTIAQGDHLLATIHFAGSTGVSGSSGIFRLTYQYSMSAGTSSASIRVRLP